MSLFAIQREVFGQDERLLTAVAVTKANSKKKKGEDKPTISSTMVARSHGFTLRQATFVSDSATQLCAHPQAEDLGGQLQ